MHAASSEGHRASERATESQCASGGKLGVNPRPHRWFTPKLDITSTPKATKGIRTVNALLEKTAAAYERRPGNTLASLSGSERAPVRLDPSCQASVNSSRLRVRIER
jgi:hypothetical protein